MIETPPQSDPDFIPSQTQPSAGGGGDPDFIPSQTQPQTQPSLLQRGTDAVTSNAGYRIPAGFVKGMEKTAAGMVDLASQQYLGPKPGETPSAASTVTAATTPGAQLTQSLPEAIRSPLRNAAQATTDFLRRNTDTHGWEKVGDIGETVAELMAMPEASIEAESGKALTYGEQLLQSGKLAKFLEANPTIAKALTTRLGKVALAGVASAPKAGAEMAGQTMAKTGGNVPESAKAGAEGAIIGGLFGAGGEAWQQGRKAVSDFAEKWLQTRPIAGADFPVTPEGELRAPELKPGMVDPATAAVDEANKNIAKTGVVNSILTKMAKRARVVTPEANPARLLPSPADSTPGFRVGLGEPTPGVGQTAPRVASGPASLVAQNSPELYDASTDAAARAGTLGAPNPLPEGSREPVQIFRNPESAESDPTKGPGTLIFTNKGRPMSVEKAQQQLGQYNSILNDPEIVGQMGTGAHQDILDAHADLSEQLRRFDDFAASQPHFPEQDPIEASRAVNTLGDTAQVLKEGNAPFWQRANELSGNQFSNLREEEKFIEKKLYSSSPIGNRDDLMQQLADNQQKQMDFFDRNRANLSPEEWEAHRDGYQDGMVLNSFNNFMESHFNGITPHDVEGTQSRTAPLQRVFNPGGDFNTQLEKFLNTGTNRQVLARTIGPDHILDYKEMGQLFETPERQAATASLRDNIASSVRRHYEGIRGMMTGGLMVGSAAYGVKSAVKAMAESAPDSSGLIKGAAGAGLAAMTPLATGTAAGAKKYVAERIMSDPAFARKFIYAVKNSIGPRIAGALLSVGLVNSLGQQDAPPPGAK